MSEWFDKWIRPWPGELIAGMVVAIHGQNLVCQTTGGFRFEVPIREAEKLVQQAAAKVPN